MMIDAVNSAACVVHAPLAELKRVVASAGATDPSSALVAWLNSKLRDGLTLSTASTSTTSGNSTSNSTSSISPSTENNPAVVPTTQVYVLCRRGIDSVAATQLLVDHGVRDVYNVEGGLTAWHATVDQRFPIY